MDKQDDIIKQADDAAILEIEEDMRVSEEYSECAESEVYIQAYIVTT